MAKRKGKSQPPSREKYEQEHPTISFRTDRETKRQIDAHREKTGSSYAVLMKGVIEGDKSKAAEKRAEILALREIGLLDEERLKWINKLVRLALSRLMEHKMSAPCPCCNEQNLRFAWGNIKGTRGRQGGEVFTWKCPNCGWFLDTFNRMDPESVGWD